MFKKTKITKEDTEDEYYRRLSLAKIDDEDVRQVFQKFLWYIQSHQIVV